LGRGADFSLTGRDIGKPRGFSLKIILPTSVIVSLGAHFVVYFLKQKRLELVSFSARRWRPRVLRRR